MVEDKLKKQLRELHDSIVKESNFELGGSKGLKKTKEIVEKMLKKQRNTPVDIQLASKLMRIYLDLPKSKTIISYSPMYEQIAKYDLSLSSACALAGINTTIRKQIKDGKTVHIDNLLKLADILECNVSDLFEEITEVEFNRRADRKKQMQRSPKLFEMTQLNYIDSENDVSTMKDDDPRNIHDNYKIDVKYADLDIIYDYYFPRDNDEVE